MLAELAMSSFLESLRAADIAVPQGVSILVSTARVSFEAAPSAVSQAGVSASFVSQGGSSHDSGHGTAVASPVRSSWFDKSVNVGVSSSRAEPAHRVSFTDVLSPDDDDRVSIVLEKTLPSEGLRLVLRLLFQLCPSAAAEAPPSPQRTCDFEGLFGSAPRPMAGEVPTNLFYQVAELLSESLLQFQTALGDQVLVRSRRCCLRLHSILPSIGWWGVCPPNAPSTFRLTRQLRSSRWPRDYWTLSQCPFGSSRPCCTGSKSWVSCHQTQLFSSNLCNPCLCRSLVLLLLLRLWPHFFRPNVAKMF